MQTGQKIAELRKKAGLTQEQLAQKLFVSRDLISKWENSKRRPDSGSLEKAAELFCVEISELKEKNTELEKELAICITDGISVKTDLRDLLNAFFETLNSRERSVFISRYYFSETPSLIGEKYAISDAHVRTILMRTRKKLKKYITEVNDELL